MAWQEHSQASAEVLSRLHGRGRSRLSEVGGPAQVRARRESEVARVVSWAQGEPIRPRVAGWSLHLKKSGFGLQPVDTDVDYAASLRFSYDPEAPEKTATVPPAFADRLAAVWQATHLQAGWRGPQSRGPSTEVANSAVAVIRLMERAGLLPDRVLPTPAGGFALYVLSHDKLGDGSSARLAEIEVEEDGHLGWSLEQREPRRFESGELESITDLLPVFKRIRKEIQGTFGAAPG